jgi:rubrerythrin
MAKTSNQSKGEIIGEMEMMKDFELTARDLYVKVANSPDVQQRQIRDTFANMAREEQEHADIVQKIINIIKNTL